MSLLSQPRPVHPRERLSLFTHSTLGHDVSAALKASSPLDITRTKAVQETLEAPPPSPVDFGRNGFHQPSQQSAEDMWAAARRRLDEEAGVVAA
ncbi:hypothetical protein BFW01_g5364 [Lasiodiplodia theobromae]|uniref:Uncharacterized protein n=2 Tax=Lasiodiplodia TaxID=66739 RepID=A0A5N5D916_9PEZI|nr:uncharacterized protein LTHEOB_12099 [Lasiodiplodia theobromae]KAB2574141.1 hypothetical protein DBV05_g7215 [Lasiodiplodia theobromae]KAF4536659.1 hypothetical protein LTHEOB_12099 [Lasiodiplodia theobromae]KAF9634469.1 hypothetical protein BFW01_g5364 [Lasiodiplodia theobromae]KAK0660234.1 hypothetical protein DIS24_g3491 [Lasiodiplodia hormozganensis]